MKTYTKTSYYNLFLDGTWTNFYKGKTLIATRDGDGPITLTHHHGPAYDTLTRAKGYRYWWKHFPGRYCWELPQALQDALDMEPATCGTFIHKKTGEIWGYEG